MLATDPDADRVGIAMKCPDGSCELVSGKRWALCCWITSALAASRRATCAENPVAVKSIVSTPLADAIAAHHGVGDAQRTDRLRGSATRSQIWKLRWTASSSASRRATAIWPVLRP